MAVVSLSHRQLLPKPSMSRWDALPSDLQRDIERRCRAQVFRDRVVALEKVLAMPSLRTRHFGCRHELHVGAAYRLCMEEFVDNRIWCLNHKGSPVWGYTQHQNQETMFAGYPGGGLAIGFLRKGEHRTMQHYPGCGERQIWNSTKPGAG